MTPHGADQGEHRDLELDSTFQRDDWPERLRAAVAKTLAARQVRRDLRTQLAERRDHGLERRHAEKLGLSKGDQVSDALSSRTGTPGDATGPTTPLESSEDRSQPAGAHTQTPAELATLERLRRAGQGGWRPTRPETEH